MLHAARGDDRTLYYFHYESRVFHPNSCLFVTLLDPCFKTGRRKPFHEHQQETEVQAHGADAAHALECLHSSHGASPARPLASQSVSHCLSGRREVPRRRPSPPEGGNFPIAARHSAPPNDARLATRTKCRAHAQSAHATQGICQCDRARVHVAHP